MRAAVVVLVVLAGCGSPAPRYRPPREPVTVVPSRPDAIALTTRIKVPQLRLAQLLPGPTWPLTSAPSLEPHYRVASPWFAACERRGHLPDDVLAYVELWCRYRREPFDLVKALLPRRSSQVIGLGDAIRRDVANLVAEARGGQAALTWIAAEASHEDVLYELLIAVYTDRGRLDDAAIVANEYVGRGSPRCSRELVEARFALDLYRRTSAMFERALSYGLGTSCGAELQRIGCIAWEVQRQRVGSAARVDCEAILDEDERAASRVLAAALGWGGPMTFMEAAQLASSAVQVSEAEELALTTLETSLLLSCNTIPQLVDIAAKIDGSPHAQPRFAARRAVLRAMTREICEAARWK